MRSLKEISSSNDSFFLRLLDSDWILGPLRVKQILVEQTTTSEGVISAIRLLDVNSLSMAVIGGGNLGHSATQ